VISGPPIRAFGLQAVALGLFVCIVSGCNDSSRTASARLRREVFDLQQEVARLELRESEQRIQFEQATTDRSDLDHEVLASTPMVTGIGMSTWSGSRGVRTDGRTTVEIFVSAVDGRNRPLQMVGTVTARALLIPVEGSPIELGAATLTPSQLRDAWRNVLGTPSYVVQLPIDQPLPEGTESIHVRVYHDDARTGRRFETSGDVRTVDGEAAVE